MALENVKISGFSLEKLVGSLDSGSPVLGLKIKSKSARKYISVQALEETERQLEGLKSRLLKEEKEYGVELKC